MTGYIPFRNSCVDTQTAHHICSYGLSQSAVISPATCHLAAEGQCSLLKIPFSGDSFCHTLMMLGGQGEYSPHCLSVTGTLTKVQKHMILITSDVDFKEQHDIRQPICALLLPSW